MRTRRRYPCLTWRGEGLGRSIARGKHLQFLRYTLGSARETRSWYYKSHHLLTEEVVRHRMELCSEISALLVTTINRRKQARR